jgi:GT2 family glycosyltransferase
MTISTSVVICAYTEKRWDQLVAAVESVQAQDEPVDQIVLVVDNHDRLLSKASERWPMLTVVANQGPQGLSEARNTGIEASSGDIVLFLDDDAVADPDWAGLLTAPYADAAILGVGGSAQPVWQQPPPMWWPREFGWVVGCSYRGQPTSVSRVRNLMGCNMSVRRSVLRAVGGFDTGLGRTPDSPLGCEETELCIRAQAHFPQGRFMLEPKAVVHHAVPAERASWPYFRARCRAEGISKARVVRSVGRTAALSAESAYVRRVLPIGVLHNLGRGLRGDLAALARAGVIVAGLAFTVAGFLKVRWTRPAGPPHEFGSTLRNFNAGAGAGAAPILPLVIDLNSPLGAIDARRAGQPPYASALCLLTRDGVPVTKVRLDLPEPVMDGEQIEAGLRSVLGPEVTGQPTQAPRDLPTDVAGRAVTVVVATRDRPDLLVKCIESVFAGRVIPDRLVVVDNAPSTDATAKLVARLARAEPRLGYVREDRPGLARAHNAGLPYVRTELVAFTDDDVLVDPRWLERLVEAFAGDDRVGCVTGLIAPQELDTLPQQWVEGNATFDKGLQRRTFDNAEHRPADPLFPLTAGVLGSGANMAFRTADLRARGGFDKALGTGTPAMGGDDLSAFYDVITAGQRFVYEPAAIVLHRHYREYSALRRQTYGYGAGLGAYLTRCVLRDPRAAWVLLRHAPAASRRARRILTPPAIPGLPPYPRDLTLQQWRGMVSGPWRYLRSRQHTRQRADT